MEAIHPLISIVVPVYNEEENVEILHREIRNAVDRLGNTYELIFIDDGSTDNTLDCLVRIKALESRDQNPLSHTRVIRFTRNFGQTAAMQSIGYQ